MTFAGRLALAILALVAPPGVAQDGASKEKPPEPSGLSMSKAVACLNVKGLEDYTILPDARLTSDDKLKVYFRPLHYKVEPFKAKYRARFTEDGRVRRKGEKTVLSKEDKLLEYEATFDAPDYQIYLTNTIGLKNLAPGDYEFDIILHDALDEGVSARQTIAFTIIPTPKAAPNAEKSDEPEAAPAPVEKKKAAKKARTGRSSRPR